MLKFFALLALCAFSLAVGGTEVENCNIDELRSDGIVIPTAKVPCYFDQCNKNPTELAGPDSECPDHCASYAGGCYSKIIPRQTLEKKYVKPEEVSGRNFHAGGLVIGAGGLYPFSSSGLPPVLPPFPRLCPKQFPDNCGVNPHDPHLYKLLEAPVNVPYCQRTPCSSSNPAFENDRFACHSQPGCYFDVELATLRRAIGYSVLPGVPTCHLAIRNVAFHRLVQKYVKTSGKEWSGLYTNCLLDQNQHEIDEAPAGCYMIDVLQFIGIKPKRAGWRGINPRECSLLGGCFKSGLGCYYPAQLRHVKVRSGEDPYRSTTPTARDMYGQPLCLPLNLESSPSDFLDSYHHCLQSGCVVDPSVTQKTLFHKLLNITLTLVPQHLRQQYYDLIQEGVISADNWEYYLNKLQSEPHYPGFPFGKQTGKQGSVDILAYTLALQANRNRSRGASLPGQYPNGRFHNSGPGFQFNFPGSQYPSFGNPTGHNPIHAHQCPYHNYNVGSFHPLKGSFAGCCEQSLCYIPRNQLTRQYSGVAPYLSNWQKWSDCTVSCGGGRRTRKRRCVAYKNQVCGSDADNTQVEVCNNNQCPHYGPWGTWGSCDASCGGGSQIRGRSCIPSDGECFGDSQETRACQTGKCPTFSQWSAFGSCSATCGVGEKVRTRSCTNGGAYGCDAVTEPLQETVRCEIFCGKTVKVATTACEYPDCQVTTAYRCEYQGGVGHCPDFKQSVTTRCYAGYCYYGK